VEISIAFVVLIAVFPIVVLRGFVLSRLWGWFIVPLGLPSIGIAQACGIALILGFLSYSKSTTTKDNYVERTVEAFVSALACWGFGAIVHWFMVQP
jgi:hypothetical protein